MMINTFPALLQSFFTDRLLQQWRASAHTVASYRDAFRLLLRFANEKLGKEPSVLSMKDLTPDFISSFLEYVEKGRNNCVRTRNARLSAIHSFFRYVSFRAPEYAELCYQILAIPSKRFERRPIEFLTRKEIDALTGHQRNNCLFPISALADESPPAFNLTRDLHGLNLGHSDFKSGFDRLFYFDAICPPVDFKGQLIGDFFLDVRFFSDQWSLDYLIRNHTASLPSIRFIAGSSNINVLYLRIS